MSQIRTSSTFSTVKPYRPRCDKESHTLNYLDPVIVISLSLTWWPLTIISSCAYCPHHNLHLLSHIAHEFIMGEPRHNFNTNFFSRKNILCLVKEYVFLLYFFMVNDFAIEIQVYHACIRIAIL